LLALTTCDLLAIRAEEDSLQLEPERLRVEADLEMHAVPAEEKKNLVAVYDGGAHSGMVLKITSWLEHSGRFNVNIVSVSKKESDTDGSVPMHPEYLTQLGVGLKEIHLSDDSYELSHSVLNTISSFQPDLVVIGATVGQFSMFQNPQFLSTIRQLPCPVIVTREFGIPGVYRAKSLFMRITGR
jgi:hypothetical protein